MIKLKRRRIFTFFFLIVVSFLIFSFLSISLYLRFRFSVLFNTADMQFHVRRIMELRDSILHGDFLPLYSFNYFHGSSVMGMYPYLNLYSFVILLFLVHSFIKSYYIFAFIVIFITLLISFFSSFSYNHFILVSYVFSIIYSLSSSILFTLFSSGDLGIFTSLSFLPLVIFGFLNIMKGSSNYLQLALGLTLMSFCQIPSLIIAISFILLWFLINLYKISKITVLFLFKSALLTILLTSVVWVPICYILLFNNIHTVIVPSLIKTINIKNFFKNIGVFSIIPILLTPIFFKRINNLNKQMYILSVFIIFVSSDIFPWHAITSLPLLSMLNKFQFTFRFLIIPQILLSYLLAVLVADFILNFPEHINNKLLLCLFVMIVVISQLCTQALIINRKIRDNPVRFNRYYSIKKKPTHYYLDSKNSIYYMINGYFTHSGGYGSDYYPITAFSQRSILAKNKGICNDKYLLNVNHSGYNKFKFCNNRYMSKFLLPLVFYNHEHMHLYMDNHSVHFRVNKHKLVVLSNVHKGYHLIRVRYNSYPWIHVCKYILVLIGILWIIFYCRVKYRS